MSGTCMEFVPKRKFADRHDTDGEQACSAGLSAKSMTVLDLETCGMQPVGWRRAEPSMVTPAVHIPPWEAMQGRGSGGRTAVCASSVRQTVKKAPRVILHAALSG